MNRVVVMMLLAGFAGSSNGQALKQCPGEFPVETITIKAPAGWTGIVPPVGLRLTSVDVILGPPKLPGAVQIGKRRKTRNGYEMIFDALYTTSHEPEEKWLACHYGDLALAQRLPDTTDRCIVTYSVRPAYNDHDIMVSCRTNPSKQ